MSIEQLQEPLEVYVENRRKKKDQILEKLFKNQLHRRKKLN